MKMEIGMLLKKHTQVLKRGVLKMTEMLKEHAEALEKGMLSEMKLMLMNHEEGLKKGSILSVGLPYIDQVTEFAESYNRLRSGDIPSSKATSFASFQCASFTSTTGNGLSRYQADFREIEQIGWGNFSRVFKVLKRLDGCMYAVKQSVKQLHSEADRARAVTEVQALIVLGYMICSCSHQNVIGYSDYWFENERLFIQLELCDHCMKGIFPMYEEVLQMLYQIARALDFIHQRGIAHLDVKTENIYVKNGVYKLGGFGCATLLDRSSILEEDDSRYRPQEIRNNNYEHLDKFDIFSLGASAYELYTGDRPPDPGPPFTRFWERKLSSFLGSPMQFQSLLTSMMDPDPTRRPSAREVMNNPLFMRKNAVFEAQSVPF